MKIVWGAVSAAIVALSFGTVGWLWPLVHGSDPDWFAYEALWRAGRLLLGAVPVFVALVLVLVMHKSKSRVWGGGLSALVLFGVAGYLVWYEYARLVPFTAQGYRWSGQPSLWKYVDKLGGAGALIALCGSFLAAGLPWLFPDPPQLGDVTPPKRSKSSVHGQAQFMSVGEAAKLFPDTVSAKAKAPLKDGVLPVVKTGSIIIGERYRVDQDSVRHVPFDPRDRDTWGRGGLASLICYDPSRFSGSTHLLAVSGSGGFKTTSITASNCLYWGYSLVVIDTDRQAYAISAKAREAMGQEVLLVTPSDPRSGFNVLDWIEPRSAQAPENVALVASWVCNTKMTGREAEGFFTGQGIALVTGLIAYAMFEPGLKPSARTLRYVRELLSIGPKALADKLAQIVEKSTTHRFVRLALGPLVGQYRATFDGIHSNADLLTKWLTYEHYADLVSQGSTPTRDIANGRTSVFLGLPVSVLSGAPGLGRTLIGALLNATKMAGEALTGRVLFIVDEAARLGHMQVLEEMRDTGRKYGITLIMRYQSLGPIRAPWGGESGLSDWMQSTGCQIFGAINDQDTAKRISDKAATYTAEVTTTSTSTVARGSAGGSGVNRSTTTNLVSVPLIRPGEITQNMRADDQIVFFGSMPPIRCGRAIYFRRPEMLRIAGEDRFARIGRTTTLPGDYDGEEQVQEPALQPS